jgi:hypothetical protein
MTNEPAIKEDFLVCTLPSPELASRRAEIQRLIEPASSVVVRPDGVLFTFQNTDEIAHALLDFIRFEQQCCGAITYELRAEPPHTELALQLRAPAALVRRVQKFYLTSEPEDKDGMAKGEVLRKVAIVREMIAPLGAVICAVVCLGLPVVSGTLGVAGMSFLRDDRLLLPFEVLCCGGFLWTFERGRQVHGRLIVIWLAFVAAGMLLGSMSLEGMHSKAAVLFACIVLTAATALNQVFLKRHPCTPDHPCASKDS